MSEDFFKVGGNPEGVKETQAKATNTGGVPPSSFSLKRGIVLFVVIIVFVALNLGGYYLYKRGYLQIGADIIQRTQNDEVPQKEYSEKTNLIPTPTLE